MAGVGYIVKGMHVDIDGKHYECAVTQVDETESHDTQQGQTACPTGGSITDVGPSSWTIDVTANADVKAPVAGVGSLYRLLTDPANAGKLASLAWVPDVVNNPAVARTAQVRLVAPSGSFPVGGWGTFTVSLPVVGAPTWNDAYVTPAEAAATEAEAEPESVQLADLGAV